MSKDSLKLISHRGPDGESFFEIDMGATSVFLGHRRLAIIDLDDRALQPMVSKSGRNVIVFNGEIYNYIEIRTRLEALGRVFRTQSDTEVLLEALEFWGLDALSELDGMFAFALLDIEAGNLTLARDPFGIKPLYYMHEHGNLSFGSEPRALLKSAGKDFRANEAAALKFYLDARYDDSTETFFDGVFQVLPGSLVQLDLPSGSLRKKQWFAPKWELTKPISGDSGLSSLEDSVRIQLRSDVPIAVALSGGVDSSAITGLASRMLASGSLTTFGFVSNDPSISEERYQLLASQSLGTEHVEVRIADGETWKSFKKSIDVLGEPCSSTSLSAQESVFSAMAARGFKVSLDGQGGDELFAGYEGYPEAKTLSALLARDFGAFQEHIAAARVEKRLPALVLGMIAEVIGVGTPRGKFARLVRLIMVHSNSLKGVRFWRSLSLYSQSKELFDVQLLAKKLKKGLQARLANDIWVNILPALLKHADRNSMAHSLESRVPFLSHRVAKIALQLAGDSQSWKPGKKVVLAHNLNGVVPSQILNRRDKVGFRSDDLSWDEIPDAEWASIRQALASQSWLSDKSIPSHVEQLQMTLGRERAIRLLALGYWIRKNLNGN